MRKWIALFALVASATTLAAADKQTGTLESATEALSADHIRSIEYTGTGKWFQFGQEPNPNALPPEFEVTSYTASIDYNSATMHVDRVSKPMIEARSVLQNSDRGKNRNTDLILFLRIPNAGPQRLL